MCNMCKDAFPLLALRGAPFRVMPGRAAQDAVWLYTRYKAMIGIMAYKRVAGVTGFAG